MSYRNRAVIDTVRTLAFGAIGAAYAAVGAQIDEPIRLVYILNNTDQNLWLSDDGVNNKFLLPNRGFILLDLTANKVRDDGFFMPQNGYWYAKHAGVAPTVGGLYITLIHA